MPRRAAARHSAGMWTPSRVRASAPAVAVAAPAPSNGARPAAAPRTPTPPPISTFLLLTPCSTLMSAPRHRSVRNVAEVREAVSPRTLVMQNDLHLARDPMPDAAVRQGSIWRLLTRWWRGAPPNSAPAG